MNIRVIEEILDYHAELIRKFEIHSSGSVGMSFREYLFGTLKKTRKFRGDLFKIKSFKTYIDYFYNLSMLEKRSTIEQEFENVKLDNQREFLNAHSIYMTRMTNSLVELHRLLRVDFGPAEKINGIFGRIMLNGHPHYFIVSAINIELEITPAEHVSPYEEFLFKIFSKPLEKQQKLIV